MKEKWFELWSEGEMNSVLRSDKKLFYAINLLYARGYGYKNAQSIDIWLTNKKVIKEDNYEKIYKEKT